MQTFFRLQKLARNISHYNFIYKLLHIKSWSYFYLCVILTISLTIISFKLWFISLFVFYMQFCSQMGHTGLLKKMKTSSFPNFGKVAKKFPQTVIKNSWFFAFFHICLFKSIESSLITELNSLMFVGEKNL